MNTSYRLHSTSMVPPSPIILVYFAAHVPPLFVVIRYPVCKTAGVFSVDIRYLCGYNTRNKYTAAYVSQMCHRRFFCGALPPAFNCSFHKFLCIVVLYHSLSFLVQPLKHSKRLREQVGRIIRYVRLCNVSVEQSCKVRCIFILYSVAPCHAYGGLCILLIPAGCRLYAHRLSPAVITPNYGLSRRPSTL